MNTQNENFLKERRLKRLNELNNKLCEELGKPTATEESIEILVQSIRKLEKEKREAEENTKLNAVNRNHAERKNIMTDLLNIKFPEENILCNDGTLHATKLKKYDSLNVFMQKYKYARFECENNTYIRCKEGRNSYTILNSEYKYNEPTKYTRFESLQDACKYNGIQFTKLSYKKFQSLQKAILKESEKIRTAIEKHNKKVNSLNAYFLENEGLIQATRNEHVKTYYQLKN